MPYPSPALTRWCRIASHLTDRQQQQIHYRSDGLFLDEIPPINSGWPPGIQAEFVSRLFWSVWIDQVLYRVLGSQNPVYEAFRKLYPFPKLYHRVPPVHASPALLLVNRAVQNLQGNHIAEGEENDFPDAPSRPHQYEAPDQKLLQEDKGKFWGEVADWLSNTDNGAVKDAAITAFEEDLRNPDRDFPDWLRYLF